MRLVEFVKQLPSDWVLAPILRKGVAGSPGKQPINELRQRQLGPDDAALIIERNKAISAVGLWTGPKGNGIVIVDCDMNDTALKRKYSELNNAPRITSTKKTLRNICSKFRRSLGGMFQVLVTAINTMKVLKFYGQAKV